MLLQINKSAAQTLVYFEWRQKLQTSQDLIQLLWIMVINSFSQTLPLALTEYWNKWNVEGEVGMDDYEVNNVALWAR